MLFLSALYFFTKEGDAREYDRSINTSFSYFCGTNILGQSQVEKK